MNKTSPIRASGQSGATEPRTSRVLGVYPQKQDGLFMQRVKILGGRINWHQWRRVAELAVEYASGFPIHVTTRQDIELHNIRRQDVGTVQQGLAEAGLTTFGACGDSVRNITVCAGCEFCPNGLDLIPLARLVRGYIEQESVAFTLPRKFKISFSGCSKACAKPWLNDLGFVGQPDGCFTVIGAGSLGAKPAVGIQLYENLRAEDILPLCTAAVEFFEQHGDRQNRRRARFRHIREKFGDDAFRAELDRRFEQVRTRTSWPCVRPRQSQSNAKLQCRLQLPHGNVTATEAVQLADAAQAQDAVVRIDLEHGLHLYGPKPVRMPEELAPMAKAPIIVACPGCTTCPRGLTDCWATAAKIREALPARDLSGVRINISGCPNGCAHSATAQIGLLGMIRKCEGQAAPHYRLLTGGGNGTTNVLATPHAILHADDVPNAISSLL